MGRILNKMKLTSFPKSNFKLLALITLLFVCSFIVLQVHVYNKYFNRLDSEELLEEAEFVVPNGRAATGKYNLFFVETDKSRLNFDLKELCAVESAALNNPGGNIYVYYLKARIGAEYLKHYSNIIPIQIQMGDIFQDTSLIGWWYQKRNIVLKSPHSIAHMSDIIRLVLLWKYGGFYSDLDTITIKSVKDLLNYPGMGYMYEYYNSLGNGVLVFPKKHPFLTLALLELEKTYNPKLWGQNGPDLVWRVANELCNVTNVFTELVFHPIRMYIEKYNIKKSANNKSILYDRAVNKCNVNIYPRRFFYTHSWTELDYLFRANESLLIKRFMDAYSLHFFGKQSGLYTNVYKQNSLYEYFASSNCPLTYKKYMINFYQKQI